MNSDPTSGTPVTPAGELKLLRLESLSDWIDIGRIPSLGVIIIILESFIEGSQARTWIKVKDKNSGAKNLRVENPRGEIPGLILTKNLTFDP